MVAKDEPTLVEHALALMKTEGIRHVFGIPGGLLFPFFDAVEHDDDFALVVSRHEAGAAFMADGLARTGGGLAVAAATSGPGATNLITGVAVAHGDGVPMLVVTGQAPSRSLGRGAAQETPRQDIDIVGMFAPITKYSAMVATPEAFSGHFHRAMRCALSGRPGPVHLNVPVDLWTACVTPPPPGRRRARSKLCDPAQVSIAADVLGKAARPLFLVGSGAIDARAPLLALVEHLGARVVTTPRAKGLVPEDHPASLGVFGFAGHAQAREAVLGDEADLLFCVGASLNETTTLNWHPAVKGHRRLVQLDVDPERIGRNYPVDVPLEGDAATIVAQLVEHLAAHPPKRPAWSRPVIPSSDDRRYLDVERRLEDATPIAPQRWRAALGDLLEDDALVFSDIGGHMLFNLHHLRIERHQRFVLNLGFGSMGHGTAAPIGAALGLAGKGDTRPVYAIIGDACFTMHGMEIVTAVEHGAKVTWIVENNGMHGISWHGSKLVTKGRGSRSIINRHPLRIAAIARELGATAHTVERLEELGPALESVRAHHGPSVIELVVDPELSPPLGDRADTVAGFKR